MTFYKEKASEMEHGKITTVNSFQFIESRFPRREYQAPIPTSIMHGAF